MKFIAKGMVISLTSLYLCTSMVVPQSCYAGDDFEQHRISPKVKSGKGLWNAFKYLTFSLAVFNFPRFVSPVSAPVHAPFEPHNPFINSLCTHLKEAEISHGYPYPQVLGFVEGQFDKAPVEDQSKIVSIPLNFDYLEKLFWKRNGEIDCDLLPTQKVYDKATPLSLAISTGNKGLVGKFLTAITDPNAPEHQVWGFRQKYNPFGVALDPNFPAYEAQLRSRVDILKLLAEKGADINFRPQEEGAYNNPPLAAGIPSGHPIGHYMDLQAAVILLGADPLRDGSSFRFDGFVGQNEVLEKALDLMMWKEFTGDKLTPSAKELLKIARSKKIKRLEELNLN